MAGKSFGIDGAKMASFDRSSYGPTTPRWSSSHGWWPEAARPLQAMMQSLQTRNISLVPWSAGAATTSSALATHPSHQAAWLAVHRACSAWRGGDEGGGPWWWSRWAPPKAQGTTAPCCPLHSDIQAAAGMLMRFVNVAEREPIQEAGQPVFEAHIQHCGHQPEGVHVSRNSMQAHADCLSSM